MLDYSGTIKNEETKAHLKEKRQLSNEKSASKIFAWIRVQSKQQNCAIILGELPERPCTNILMSAV